MRVASLKQVRCAAVQLPAPGEIGAIDVQAPEVGYWPVVPAWQAAVTTICANLIICPVRDTATEQLLDSTIY